VGIESYKIMDIIFVVGICHPSVGVADSSPQREPKSLFLRRDARSDGVVASVEKR
jgi:hypothetical protein